MHLAGLLFNRAHLLRGANFLFYKALGGIFGVDRLVTARRESNLTRTGISEHNTSVRTVVWGKGCASSGKSMWTERPLTNNNRLSTLGANSIFGHSTTQ